MIISVFDKVENIVGKGEIACTSNLSFSHYVFKRLLSQARQKVSLCGNGLKFVCVFFIKKKFKCKHSFQLMELLFKITKSKTMFSTLPKTNYSSHICLVVMKPCENIAGKGEIACTTNFSFSHNAIYSIKDRNYQFC